MELTEGNISTVATMIYGLIGMPILNAIGIHIDQEIAVAIISALILLGFLIWSAINPNTLAIFGNKKPVTIDEAILNDEYVVTGDCDDS